MARNMRMLKKYSGEYITICTCPNSVEEENPGCPLLCIQCNSKSHQAAQVFEHFKFIVGSGNVQSCVLIFHPLEVSVLREPSHKLLHCTIIIGIGQENKSIRMHQCAPRLVRMPTLPAFYVAC